VLALEVVLPTGEVLHTGSKAVKNVVGYDLTQLLVGSEGTLAIVTKITLRLIPKPPARETLAAAFATIRDAVNAVTALIAARVVPAAIELIDDASLRAASEFSGRTFPGRVLLIAECDGSAPAVADEIARVDEACRSAGALDVSRAVDDEERAALWLVRRQVSLALRATGLLKINHDVVVPRGRVPALFEVVAELRQRFDLLIAAFGHAGDGNIHVNLMIDPQNAAARERASAAEQQLFQRVVALDGSISGEHGIGFAKARYLHLELAPEQIALLRRVKAAFDPNGILNPGKIFDSAP
jgi:glycolate oxidase